MSEQVEITLPVCLFCHSCGSRSRVPPQAQPHVCASCNSEAVQVIFGIADNPATDLSSSSPLLGPASSAFAQLLTSIMRLDGVLNVKRTSPEFVNHMIARLTTQDGFCVICTSPIPAGEDIFPLPCGHSFHLECIKQWLLVDHTCPSCRFELMTKDADYWASVGDQAKAKEAEDREKAERSQIIGEALSGLFGLEGGDQIDLESFPSIEVEEFSESPTDIQAIPEFPPFASRSVCSRHRAARIRRIKPRPAPDFDSIERNPVRLGRVFRGGRGRRTSSFRPSVMPVIGRGL